MGPPTVGSEATRQLVAAAETLADAVEALAFAPPTTHIYNPLRYAWQAHRNYLLRYGGGPKKVIFLGMNPGPFGMAQTGVPFGEVAAARDWLGLEVPVERPSGEHPKRPVEGFACTRSEVSGRRLWGLFAERFGPAESFFQEYFVSNYCPLVFMEASGRNRTPDKLPAAEAEALYAVCDAHLRAVVACLQPEWLVGVGAFAEARARLALEAMPARDRPKLGRILHPSPASPAANRGWGEQAAAQLEALGIW